VVQIAKAAADFMGRSLLPFAVQVTGTFRSACHRWGWFGETRFPWL